MMEYKGEHALNEYSGTCAFCDKKLAKSKQEKTRDYVEDMEQSERQRVLDYIHKGKTIGETMRHFNLEMDVVCEIINQNIGVTRFLKKEAV